jgi:hypothetical protein
VSHPQRVVRCANVGTSFHLPFPSTCCGWDSRAPGQCADRMECRGRNVWTKERHAESRQNKVIQGENNVKNELGSRILKIPELCFFDRRREHFCPTCHPNNADSLGNNVCVTFLQNFLETYHPWCKNSNRSPTNGVTVTL